MIFHFMLLLSIYSVKVCYARNSFPDQTDNNFQKKCLSLTNNYRDKHHAPALKIDQKAITYAKSRCQLISKQEKLNHGHAGLKGYGENLYWGGKTASGYFDCKPAIDSWYNEVKKYNYNNPGFSGATGHFTQVVWKSSTGQGCARCGGKGSKWYETYIVCSYSPPGNVLNNFQQNVLKP